MKKNVEISIEEALKKERNRSYENEDNKFRGAPRKSDDEKLSRKYQVYFTELEAQKIDNIARKNYMKIAAYIRSVLLNHINSL
ncbi:MAG: hypothetical protein LBP54_02555 [Campylobacteraceae bacterium]|jgi:hypothetical protein|nr:hypothetical protein [Campylobacteraceae bacterium]